MIAFQKVTLAAAFALGLMGCATQGVTAPQSASGSTYLTESGRLAVKPPANVTGEVGASTQSSSERTASVSVSGRQLAPQSAEAVRANQSAPAQFSVACAEGGSEGAAASPNARLCP